MQLDAFLSEIGIRTPQVRWWKGKIFARSYINAFVTALDKCTMDSGKSVWVEKTPRHLHFVDLIEATVPNPVFIHIVRDGEDTVASLYDVTHRYPEHWGGVRSVQACVERWMTDMVLSMRYCREREHHVLVRYEELVHDPHVVLHQLCKAIGVPFHDAMADEYSSTSGQLIQHSEEWKKDVTKPLRRPTTRKFHTCLTKAEQMFVSRCTATIALPKNSVSCERKGKQPLRVLMTPVAWGNPYQQLLAKGLAENGVEPQLSTYRGRWPILGALHKHGPVDLLHLHWLHPLLVERSRSRMIAKSVRFLLELCAAKLRGVRVVWTVHNLLSHERIHPRLELLFARIAVRFFDGVIVHCCSALDAVKRTYRLPPRLVGGIAVIPHGNYIDAYGPRVPQTEARTQLGLPQDHLVLLCIGQIRRYKGVPKLIDAFSKADVEHGLLIIAGKPAGEDIRQEIVERAGGNPRIRLHMEFVPDDELGRWLGAADAVVLTYVDVLTSDAALLAMSFGKAVIAPRLGCAPELVEDSKGGVLYDSQEPGSLAEAIRKASCMDLATCGKHNLACAVELDWKRIGLETQGVYEEIVEEMEGKTAQ